MIINKIILIKILIRILYIIYFLKKINSFNNIFKCNFFYIHYIKIKYMILV